MSGREEETRALLDSLEGLNSSRSQALVQRTRRNVMESAQRMQASRGESRQRLGIALLALLVLLLLATPALWSFSEVAFSESAMTEVWILTLTVFVVLLSSALGAVLSRGRRGIRE
jgi:cation transport ATPase